MGENKSKEESLRDDLNNAKNHNGCLINVIVVLTCIIIAMIAILCYNKKDFSEQISFASTITSIVLSVIAIIMTVVSGETLNNLLHKFRDLHDDIKEVPSKFEQTTDRFEKSCKDIESVQKDIEQFPDELINTRNKVEDLYNILSATHGDVKIVDSKLNQLFMSEFKGEYSEAIEKIPDKFIDNLCNCMPYQGMCVFYFLYVSYKSQKSFDYDCVIKINSMQGIEYYFLGIISVLNLADIIRVSKVDNSYSIISEMSPYFCSTIKEKFFSYIQDNPEELEEFESGKLENPKDYVERINKLFGYKE